MGTAWPISPFWDFSLEIYGRPGVEAACLALQDTHRLDVNLVLFAAWLAAAGRRLPPSLAEQARRLGDDHQARVMQPLREARRALRGPQAGSDPDRLRDDCRRSLLRVELDLERLEQLQLESLAAAAPNDAGPYDATSAPALLFSANLAALYPDRALPSASVAILATQLAPGASPCADQASP